MRQERGAAYVEAFICDTFIGGWCGHSDRSGVAGPQGCENDDDLHTCDESSWFGGDKSTGSFARHSAKAQVRERIWIRRQRDSGVSGVKDANC